MSVAVLGAGNGGCAAAADLTLRGFEVTLYNRSRARLEPIAAQRGIHISGAAGDGFAEVASLTDNLAEAVAGAEVLVLCLPTSALADLAPALGKLLRPDQIVVLNPGHMGSLYLRRAALAHSVNELFLCETATLTYACRMDGPASVVVYQVVRGVHFAALPAARTDELHERIAPLFPAIESVGSVLETGLRNLNAVEHPAQMLLNAGRVEHTRGDFRFYIDGTTPAVAQVVEKVDSERMALAEAMGISTSSFVEYFLAAGYTTNEGAESGRVFDAMQLSETNSRMQAPPTLDHRYLHEDVGWGLVPWIELARLFGVAVPTMKALTWTAGVVSGIDYMAEGLTLERMGFDGLGRAEIKEIVIGGSRG